jgi:hypothetical protein
MNIQAWIIGQIAIDLLMAGVLIWLITSGNRRRTREAEERQNAVEKAEEILAQMNAITRDLDKNLEEKRELTARLLGRLEESLERAELRYEKINGLSDHDDLASKRDTVSLSETRHATKSIRSLLNKGLSKEEVARHLNISIGEIDLFLKLGERGKEY